MSFRVLSLAALLLGTGLSAEARTWEVTSPDHGQTYAYGSERHRSWITRGNHLSIVMEFTNDPYVDRVEIRQYDDFEFNFPQVTLGRDGKTFFYHPRGRAPVAVATRHAGLFGAEIRLLPNSQLSVERSHGFLRLTLLVED